MPDKPFLSKKERKKEYLKEYRRANRAKLLEHKKQYWRANRAKFAKHKKAYWIANREQLSERQKEYYLENREEIAERRKKYKAANPEKVAEYGRKYRLANPDKSRHNRQLRKARERELEATLTETEWAQILESHFGACHYCGVKSDSLTQDHVVPVSKRGGYTAENIVPACMSCNSSKGPRDYKKFVKGSKDRLQMELF